MESVSEVVNQPRDVLFDRFQFFLLIKEVVYDHKPLNDHESK